MKTHTYFAILSAALGTLSASADVDCAKLTLNVRQAIAADQSKLLEVVAADVAASPACSCEIVKVAVEASKANPDTVAAIVQAAATAAPEQMRLISQCAVAVAPDALSKVQAVMAKLDPNLGEAAPSAKSAKSPVGQVAATPNPLDFPGIGPVGPTPGGPGGLAVTPLSVAFPVFPSGAVSAPGVVNSPVVTPIP
jgi:hypothetical protein